MALYEKSLKNKSAFKIKFSKKQVQDSSTDAFNGSVPLGLNITQTRRYTSAKVNKTGFEVSFSQAQMTKRGGFFGAIIPALAAMAPGLLGAAPGIFEGIKSGFENFGKLLGIKPVGSGLTIHGGNMQNLEKFVEGSSLKIHGEGLKGLQPAPHEVNY
jgi:hypothetical protein